jgi:pimeloyl-ACP methyl ester carboxylesterase
VAASTPPLIVLVHGAFHGAWCWAALQAELDRRGLPSIALDLPGHGASRELLGDLNGDAAAVRALTDKFADPILLVAHSYGGAVVTQAAAGAANVRHIVYLTAFIPDEGEAVLPLSQSLPPVDYALLHALVIGTTSMTIDPARARATFYGCCDPEVAAAATARLDAQSLLTMTQPLTAAAWKTIPSTFVRCLRDEAIPISHQDVMAARCGNVETLDTDHSPFSSRTAQTADIIEQALKSVVGSE